MAIVSLFLLVHGGSAEARSLLERLDQRVWGHDASLDSAYELYDQGNYADAAKAFAAARNQQASQALNYNAGVAAYKSGKPDDALPYLAKAAAGSDPKLKAKALFNAGVIHIDKNELEPARDSLKEALAYDNDNKAIRENLEWVEAQLKAQPPPPKDQNQKDQDQKNQAENQDQKQDKEKEQEKDKGQSQDQKNKDEKSAEKQKSEEKKDGKDSSGKPGDPQDQKNAQEQKSQEQKDKEQKAQSGEASQKDQEKSQDKGGGGQDLAKDKEQEKEKEKEKAEQAKAMQAQKDQGKDQAGDPKAKAAQAMEPGKAQSEDSGKGHAQAIMTPAELKQQEAERLLRSIDDKIGLYPLTDTEATGTRGKDGKNW